MVKFTFSKDLGKKKKGSVVEMHHTTAAALKKAGYGEHTKYVPQAKKEEGKAEAIGKK
jgi:hypothetical protein